MAALDRIWLWYLLIVLAVVFLFGGSAPHAASDLQLYFGVHLGLLLVLVGLIKSRAKTSIQRARLWRCGYVVVALPTVFSSLGWLLPAVHPQPYEFLWISVDRALFGVDPTVWAQRWLDPWRVEIMQWAYASFYLIPIVVLLSIARRGDGPSFDRVLAAVVFGFLFSYLGYILLPTLPPYRYLVHLEPLRGVLFAEVIHDFLNRIEGNPCDCFPSGHTMMTLVSLGLAWRYSPRLFLPLSVLGLILIASTIALRYHYAIDVLAGMVLACAMATVLRPCWRTE